MRRFLTGLKNNFCILIALLILPISTIAQVDEICGEFGLIPSLAAPRLSAPFIYGKITMKGFDQTSKSPRVSVTYLNRGQSPNRISLGKSGNYCFQVTGGQGGTLVIDVDGVEVARKPLSTDNTAQQREDFELFPAQNSKSMPPGTVSAKYYHPPNEKTVELHRKALEAETNKDAKAAIGFLKEIVSIDPADFIAWALLATQYADQKSFADADAAFRRSLELKPEYTPAWINVGKMRVVQNQLDAAIGIFQHAVELDPTSARTFQILGETYLQAKKGSLGVVALNEAIRLDPIGMAECHLLIARLYDLAGAKKDAAKEYKTFLEKVPAHPEKKKFEKYIKDNPPNYTRARRRQFPSFHFRH